MALQQLASAKLCGVVYSRDGVAIPFDIGRSICLLYNVNVILKQNLVKSQISYTKNRCHGKALGLLIVINIKTKFHYAILVTDRSEASRKPAASWNLVYHLAS